MAENRPRPRAVISGNGIIDITAIDCK